MKKHVKTEFHKNMDALEVLEDKIGFNDKTPKNDRVEHYGRVFSTPQSPNGQIDLSGFDEKEIQDLLAEGSIIQQ